MSRILTTNSLNPAALHQQALQQAMRAQHLDDMHMHTSSRIMAAMVAAVLPQAVSTGEQINFEFLAGEAIVATNTLLAQYGIKTRTRAEPQAPEATRTMYDSLDEKEKAEGEATERYTNQD